MPGRAIISFFTKSIPTSSRWPGSISAICPTASGQIDDMVLGRCADFARTAIARAIRPVGPRRLQRRRHPGPPADQRSIGNLSSAISIRRERRWSSTSRTLISTRRRSSPAWPASSASGGPAANRGGLRPQHLPHRLDGPVARRGADRSRCDAAPGSVPVADREIVWTDADSNLFEILK